ncbi:MAG: hypothetical protein LQ346_005198 [Caloplaca aetnensis]|nr:MAG: hypothetical protein LQ346_005198 [Caloplaca aetnensis]
MGNCSALDAKIAALALKFSILYFYHRIFAVPKFTIWCTIIAIVTLAWFIAFVIASFLTCRPLKCSWDPTGPTCKCFDFRKIGYYITTPPDILTNLAILVLPMPWLWGLQMKMKRKLAVTFIFLLGSFSAAGSVVRIPFLSELKVNDIAYSAVDLGIWINVEIGLGIVSGCLPVMRPLFSAAFTSQLRSRFSKYSKSRSGGSERLPDSNDPSSHPSSNAKVPAHRINRLDSGDLYTGPPHKQQKTWYNNLNASGARTSTRDDGESGQGSEEEIIPMGRIQVKHDLEWEQEGPGPKVGDAS